ncbi:MAG: dihydrofolate reductase family protein [Mycobacteriales bacterium]
MRLLLPEARPLDEDDLHDLYDPGEGPCLRAGFILTTDGGIAYDGGSRPLRSPADEAVFHALRAVCDAVVVGAGTARSERYGPVRPRPFGAAWRGQHARGAVPPLVVVSRSLDLGPADRCFQGPVVVVTCASADRGRKDMLAEVADVVVAGADRVDLAAAVSALHERGLTRLLCEGGPRLLTDLLQAGLVDELCLTFTPLLLGTAPRLLTASLAPPRRLELRHLVDGDGGVLLARYLVRPAA